ncbi:MAG: phospholipase D family protein [Deltaproteobacteria bacterium]|nr:phospholipase D family protein [Deltaproteobacteria bacterium]
MGDAEAYFCPEDDCASVVISQIGRAKSSIMFMYFSFTSGEIALQLLKMHKQGVRVEGIFENTQLSQYSQFWMLRFQGVDVSEDCAGMLHHKVMVIDNKTVITGSYNPTQNAQLRNDENLVVINDRDLALAYIKEYKKRKECFRGS